MVFSTGYGKIILFGEHFVVHGLPAIASSIDLSTTVSLKRSHTNDNTIRGNNSSLMKLLKKAKKFYGRREYISLTNVISSIPRGKGLGSSAALSNAIIGAVAELLQIPLDDHKKFIGTNYLESIHHGTPSGVDAMATLGRGIFRFEKPNIFETISVTPQLHYILVDSYQIGKTKHMIEKVRQYSHIFPNEFQHTLLIADEIILKADGALRNHDLELLGNLMMRNHELLRKLGVSTSRIDSLCSILLEKGAIGAKLTGAGGGGFVMGLVKNKEHGQKIQSALKHDDIESQLISIGKTPQDDN